MFISIEHTQITQEHIQLAHENGLTVQSWTVDDAAQIQKLFDMGVDIVMSNNIEPKN